MEKPAVAAYLDSLETQEIQIHKENIDKIKQLRALFDQVEHAWKQRPAVKMEIVQPAPAGRIVNLDKPVNSGPKIKIIAAIKAAIRAQAGNFMGQDLLDYVLKSYPDLPVERQIIAKRLYQLEKQKFIEVAIPGKNAKSPKTYRIVKK